VAPDRWQWAKDAFQAAVARAPEARAAFLDEACRGEASLRADVESLLAAHDTAGGFLSGGGALETDSSAVEMPPSPVAKIGPGSKLGPYEIIAPIGAGGMGEVFRARDGKLARDVAIKVLPERVAQHPDALARFEREAKAVAALSHPNILAIHDFGSHDGTAYAVMELLEGKTLRERLRTGDLPVRKAVEQALQIAHGLAATHAKGIVHRDLKPENIFITTDGRVKILDFGLARQTLVVRDNDTPTESRHTAPGTVLGTVGYMSPEQVKGKLADHRSDIFSLGCVLYEMLSGQRAFQRDTTAETMTAILNEDPPDIAASKPAIHPTLEHIVRHCLEKNPEERFQSARDLAFGLETAVASSGPSSPTGAIATNGKPHRRLAYSVLAVVALGLVVAGWALKGAAPQAPVAPITITPFTTDGGWKNSPRLSPDGEKVAYEWSGPDGDTWDIYVKAVGPGTKPVRITEVPGGEWSPTWSPDGLQIAFWRERLDGPGALYTIPALGGQERKLVDVVGIGRTSGGYIVPIPCWAPDGEWLALAEKESEDTPARIVRLSLATLEKQPLTSPPPGSMGDLDPQISPDGRLLAFVRSVPSWGSLDVWVQPVTGGAARRLTSGQYPYAWGLSWTPDGAAILFSSKGSGGGGRQSRVPLAGGAPQPVVGLGENADSASVRGDRMVYVQRTTSITDTWRLPRPGGSRSTERPEKFLAASGRTSYSPDGRKIAFESSRDGVTNIWLSTADGSRSVQLTTSKSHAGSPGWSPDGRRLVFDSDAAGNWDLYVVAADGGMPRRLTQEPTNEQMGTFSRDGRFIYFGSDRTGRAETWRIPSDGGPAVQVTRGGSGYALESEDGRELYYSKPSPSGIWRVPLSGGNESEVVKGPVEPTDWALTRRGIYYGTWTVADQASFHLREFNVQYLEFSSGRVTSLFRRGGANNWFLNVSPDEKWILFGEAPKQQSELMLMEHFR
jgi:eukaryotic-like serine/threonine-protein kinase